MSTEAEQFRNFVLTSYLSDVLIVLLLRSPWCVCVCVLYIKHKETTAYIRLVVKAEFPVTGSVIPAMN